MREFKCIVTTRAAEKARLIRVVGREIWLPRSLTRRITMFKPDTSGEREAEDWRCEQNNL
jgi:hypothetical protein